LHHFPQNCVNSLEKVLREQLWRRASQLLQPLSSPYLPYRDDPVGYAQNVLGVQWWSKQQEVARLLCEPPYRVLVKACHEVGKCMEADEVLPLADGRMVRAGDLVGRYFAVMAWQPDGVQTPALAFAEDNGVRPVYRITTHTGRSIVRTGNHPLWCGTKVTNRAHPAVSPAGWKPMADIEEGEHVLVPLCHDAKGNRTANDDHVKLLGYLLGDGGTTRQIRFSQKDEFIAIVNRLGCGARRMGEIDLLVSGAGDEHCKAAGRNPVLNLAREWGVFGKLSREKSFPPWAWELPNEQLALLLNRLFACDGWAYSNSNASQKIARVGISLASERMIRDVESAMLRLGIPGRVRKKPVKLASKVFDSWEWVAYTASAIARFSRVVGIFGKEDSVERAVDVGRKQDPNRIRWWRTKNAPDGYQWDTVNSIGLVGERPTVGVCVPGQSTYVSTFVEHNTFLAGGLVNWWFDTRDPGLCLTTAPTYAQVTDLLWKEVRTQRRGRGGFRGPKMPRLETSERHWAHGYTAGSATSFQGRHEADVLSIFDEALGVDSEFWEAAETMATRWVAIFNPTDVSSQAYVEERSGRWRVVTMSALEHPNIMAELAGLPPPFPAAIRLTRLDSLIRKWCTRVPSGDRLATDVEWFPGSGEWWRPGPLAESRLFGRWPSQATNSVWSEALLEAVLRIAPEPKKDSVPEVGCDPARFGDDFTSIHWRDGCVSLGHETHNGWGTDVTAGRLKQLCKQLAVYCKEKNPDLVVRPEDIPVKVDVDGLGAGVVDQKGAYRFIPVSGASAATSSDYHNRRSELWFNGADLARHGKISWARLPKDVQELLRTQCLQPVYKVNSQGECELERKEDTKKRLKRSPDDADGLNLAYWPVGGFVAPKPPKERPKVSVYERKHETGRRLYGR